jgi:hypothetical protein
MDLRTARNVDPAVFTAAFDSTPKPAFQAVTVDEGGSPVGREVAVYTKSGPAGELIGLMSWQDALAALATARGYAFLEGGSMGEDGKLAETVGRADKDRVGRLTARRAELQAKIDDIDERLV